MRLRARANNNVIAENQNVASYARKISLGLQITKEENQKIHELNKKLPEESQLITVEKWEEIHGRKYDGLV